MATQKNNWLNAKPVTRTGGKSGGVRKPNKPYSKPPAKPKAETPARWDAKTKSERLQQAAKTKPSSPAPRQVVKKPVTRTGPVKGPVAPKGSTGPATMPNSKRAGVNLPQTGARAERTSTRANQLIKDARAKAASAPKPSPASTPKPSAPAASAVSRVGGVRRIGGGLVAGTALTAAAGKAIETLGRAANPNEWRRVQQELKDRGYGGNKSKPIMQGNAQSRFAGARDANLKRINSDPRFAAPKEKPKPPAPTQSGGGSTQSRSGGGGSSRPAAPAPRRQPGPAADAGMKNQDKNYKGKYLQQFKEETGRMSAANLSRQQGRSNLTSSDLKPKPEKTLREKMDELKKKRNNTAFGGA
jgi:hypothetical protein